MLWARAIAIGCLVSCGLLVETTATASVENDVSRGLAEARTESVADAVSVPNSIPNSASEPSPALVPEVIWRFRAASPSSGPPAVSIDGQVYLSTVEGYIHALASDGGFRWSYTVEGLPQGGGVVGPEGRLYLTTNAGRIYALQPNGQLGWLKRSRARISSPPVFISSSAIVYNSVFGKVRSVSLGKGRAWSHQLTSRLIAEPTSIPAGGATVVTQDGRLWWLSAANRARAVKLPAPAQWSPVAAQGLSLVIVQGQLLAYDLVSKSLRWQVAAQRAASDAGGGILVALQQGELMWLDSNNGQPQWTVALPGRASARPLVLPSGVVAVPLVSGRLFLASLNSEETALLTVGTAPLRRPVSASIAGQPATKGRMAIASGSGQLAMVDIGRWPTFKSEVAVELKVGPGGTGERLQGFGRSAP